VSDTRTGLVVSDPRDPAQLAGHLRHLLANPALAATMGAAGRARAKTEFSYDTLAVRLREALDTAARGG